MNKLEKFNQQLMQSIDLSIDYCTVPNRIKRTSFSYRILAKDLGLSEVSDIFIETVKNHCQFLNIEVTYNEGIRGFTVQFELTKVTLSPSQAKRLREVGKSRDAAPVD